MSNKIREIETVALYLLLFVFLASGGLEFGLWIADKLTGHRPPKLVGVEVAPGGAARLYAAVRKADVDFLKLDHLKALVGYESVLGSFHSLSRAFPANRSFYRESELVVSNRVFLASIAIRLSELRRFERNAEVRN